MRKISDFDFPLKAFISNLLDFPVFFGIVLYRISLIIDLYVDLSLFLNFSHFGE